MIVTVSFESVEAEQSLTFQATVILEKLGSFC